MKLEMYLYNDAKVNFKYERHDFTEDFMVIFHKNRTSFIPMDNITYFTIISED